MILCVRLKYTSRYAITATTPCAVTYAYARIRRLTRLWSGLYRLPVTETVIGFGSPSVIAVWQHLIRVSLSRLDFMVVMRGARSRAPGSYCSRSTNPRMATTHSFGSEGDGFLNCDRSFIHALPQGIVVGHKFVIPLRSKVGASPAREGGLPSTINFRHAIKNRKLSLPGFAGSKDRSLQQPLQIIGMDGAQVAIFRLLPVSISSLSHKSSRSGKIILPNAQGSTISQCTVRKNDPAGNSSQIL